jgi:hypothetical protein
MTSPRYAELAAKVLRESRDAVSNARAAVFPEASPEARARSAEAIANAIGARARARRVRRVVGVAMAAVVALGIGTAAATRRTEAPVALAFVGVASPLLADAPVARTAGGVVIAGADGDAPLVDGTPLVRGKRLVARAAGHATLAFATGTELTLEEKGDLTIDDGGASQRFTLGAGAVSAHVAKLAAGQELVVATPDAEVHVRGTTFRVAVVAADAACGGGTTTRVEVTEGAVVVRAAGSETMVAAGDKWPHCAVASNAPVAADPKRAAPPPALQSQLADQNDLFAEAVAAKRRGAAGIAIATFDRFLAKYPSSPLAESAAAERMRLLRGGDRAAARAAARDYLARFPSGFARADAQAILAEAP